MSWTWYDAGPSLYRCGCCGKAIKPRGRTLHENNCRRKVLELQAKHVKPRTKR